MRRKPAFCTGNEWRWRGKHAPAAAAAAAAKKKKKKKKMEWGPEKKARPISLLGSP